MNFVRPSRLLRVRVNHGKLPTPPSFSFFLSSSSHAYQGDIKFPRLTITLQGTSGTIIISSRHASSSSSSSSAKASRQKPPPKISPLKLTKPTERLAPKPLGTRYDNQPGSLRSRLAKSIPPKPALNSYARQRREAALPPVDPSSRVFRATKADHLPYQVLLSKSGNLPVYQKHRKDGAIECTWIRKVRGDRESLARDIAEYCRIPAENIEIREPAGYVQIKGEYAAKIKEFLALKGMGPASAFPEAPATATAEAVPPLPSSVTAETQAAAATI